MTAELKEELLSARIPGIIRDYDIRLSEMRYNRFLLEQEIAEFDFENSEKISKDRSLTNQFMRDHQRQCFQLQKDYKKVKHNLEELNRNIGVVVAERVFYHQKMMDRRIAVSLNEDTNNE
jgi:hypothetical protein